MRRYNFWLLGGIILLLLSVGFWIYYNHRNNEARLYEEQIMETKGLFRKQAQEWIKNHEPYIYENPYDRVALGFSFLGVISLTGFAVTRGP